ncbi:MAG: BolA family protein [Pseudomonadota bacterium]
MSVADTIKQKLEMAFTPSELKIIDDSDKHIGHAGHDGQGESHFRVTIVSDSFDGLSRVQRQRKVFDILADEMAGRVHALSLKCLTLQEK